MRTLSLYVHVPFCTRRCSYCSFFHVQSIAEGEGRFVEALERELESAVDDLGGDVRFRTVFIGGGTPSAIGRASLDRVLRLVNQWTGDETVEFTVELNPEDVTVDLVDALHDAGVSRISLGIQSMNPIAQKVLRRCPPEVNLSAIDTVRRRFDNVSFDVLLGVPGSSLDELQTTIRRLAELRPQHFSVYCLEPGGDMEDEVARFFTAVDPDRSADEYLFTCAFLAKQGYEHYEISNFALPGFASAHNRAYWTGENYLGVGPGAHSYIDGRRFHNLPSLDDYFAHRGAARHAARVYDDVASPELERLMLDLRTSAGASLDGHRIDREAAASLSRDDLVRVDGDNLRLTDRGFLVANEIVMRLLPAA